MTLAIMVVSVAAAAGRGYLIHATAGRRGGEEQIRELIGEADYELSLGYYGNALQRLTAAARESRREQDLLAILKRARGIATTSGDYTPLARLSEIALDRRPGSRRIGEIHVYAAIRADKGGKAAAWLSRLSGRRESEAVVAEAYLRGRFGDLDPGELSGDTGRLLGLVRERDPVRLEDAARAHGDARLWLDAALSWMAAGDVQRAWQAVQQAAGLPAGREPAVYMAFDGGRYEEALGLLQSNAAVAASAQMMVLAADASLLAGLAEAEERYRSVVEAWPDFTWTAYLNLADLREMAGEGDVAHSLRGRAQELFPGVEAVALAYAGQLQRRGESEAARIVIKRLLTEAPDSVAAHLRLLDLEGTAASPLVYTAALWELLRKHPGDGAVCRMLVLYLLGLRDYAGAEIALTEYERASPAGGRPWLEEYRAVLAAVQGDLAGAAAAMERSVELEPTWRRRYNLAVLHSAAGRAQAAIQELRQAEELLRGVGQAPGEVGPAAGELSVGRSVERSRIRALVGEQLAALSDLQGARRECEYALDLDPLNHRARLVLSLLDGR